MTLASLRVVHVVPGLQLGGAERLAANLTVGLAARVERMLLAASRSGPFEATVREAGVPVVWIPRPSPTPRGVFAAGRALARLLVEERVDLVHAFNPASSAAAGLARRLARRPEVAIVASYHGVPGRPVSRAARVFALSADLIAGCSPSQTSELCAAGLPEKRLVTINNAVDSAARRQAGDIRSEFNLNGEEVVVSVGRYAVEKDQALLIDAFAELSERRPQLRGLIVGEGPLEHELQARIDAHGLGDVLQLTGPRVDAVDIIAAADAFAFSSSTEALPMVLLEALSVGCPVATTAVGGIPDLIEHERTGLLVRAGDRTGLAQAIERLLDDPTLRKTVIANGERLIARKFSEATMLDRFAAFYTSAVAKRRRAFG